MGGECHMMDMVNRMKQNQRMLKDRQDRVRSIREMYQEHTIKQKTKPHEPPPNLKSIKEEIRRELKQKRRRALIVSGSIVLIAAVIIIFLAEWL